MCGWVHVCLVGFPRAAVQGGAGSLSRLVSLVGVSEGSIACLGEWLGACARVRGLRAVCVWRARCCESCDGAAAWLPDRAALCGGGGSLPESDSEGELLARVPGCARSSQGVTLPRQACAAALRWDSVGARA